MKHLKTFERLQEDETLNDLKKGDKVVYNEGNSTLKQGQTYIINSILKNRINKQEEVDSIKDGDFITVKDLDGNIIYYKNTGEPMVFYSNKFTTTIIYDTQKYNL